MDDNSETDSSPESTQSVVDAYLKQPTESIKCNPYYIGREVKATYLT